MAAVAVDSGELKSIFAHEFAHFTGKDTVYSRRVLPVHKTISSVFQNLQMEGSGSWTEVLIDILLIIPRYCIMTFVNYFGSIDSLLSRRWERESRISQRMTGTRRTSPPWSEFSKSSNRCSMICRPDACLLPKAQVDLEINCDKFYTEYRKRVCLIGLASCLAHQQLQRAL